MSKVTFIEISVGQLPEWYDESQHDFCLEQAIEDRWHKNPAYESAQINVVYNYNSPDAIVKAYDDDGDLIFERDDHDVEYAFNYAQENC